MKKKLSPILVTLGIVGAILFVVFAVMNPSNDSKPGDSTEKPKVVATNSQKEQMKQGNSKGNLDSKVVVTEFGDFQCPACANVEEILKQSLFPKYGDKIKFVFKHLPLTEIHKNALSSSYAAEAAAVQGKFWEMHDLLYAKQAEWSEIADPQPKYEAYASQIGLDVAKFKQDMKSKDVKAIVEKDKKLGEDLKIPGTPSFFVNGEFVELNAITDLTNAIEKALAQ
jgi:protein-disulfide isomerase